MIAATRAVAVLALLVMVPGLVETLRIEGRAGVSTDPALREAYTAKAREFRNFLRLHRDERHCVALQDFPDPDAISSGLAYREIARSFGITVDIVYEGLISHPENLALVNLLEIDLTRNNRRVAHYEALNDAVINKASLARMIAEGGTIHGPSGQDWSKFLCATQSCLNGEVGLMPSRGPWSRADRSLAMV